MKSVYLSLQTVFLATVRAVEMRRRRMRTKVHFNYANFLKDSGRGQEAIQFTAMPSSEAPVQHFALCTVTFALLYRPAVSHNNLGSLLSGQEAEFHFRQAVQHNPQHYKAAYNLARNLE